MASITTNSFINKTFGHHLFNGDVHFDTDVFKIILLDPSFGPVYNISIHNTYSSVQEYEVADGDTYSVGGKTLSGYEVVVEPYYGSEITYFKWNDVVWDPGTDIAGPISYSAIYNDTLPDKSIFLCTEFLNVGYSSWTYANYYIQGSNSLHIGRIQMFATSQSSSYY